ncbi:capsule biosynthesis protein CapA [Staphylococcus gallinarum]|uniref:YveK family protein n=1 Tax=Staphylococcus gallinarum TaxID=1293 RepID=UPI001E529CBD|nr:Wzz/FepE/Etk N-terminal domain-containing protein [Staphylococcus gallinarum]MCD8909783.1 capsule biosynthesis protein CapA [Staphylococcus gallinarum]
MENTIDLSKIMSILKKNIKLLILLPLIGLIISAIITVFFITPKYEATTQVLVNEKEKDQQMMAQEVQNNIQLVNTYAEIVKSPRIVDEVSKKLHHKYSSNELTGMLKVSNQDETQLLNIAIDSNNDKDSEKIANTFAKVFSKEVPEIMSVDNVSILSSAKGTSEQVEPKTIMNLVLGLVLGMIVALLIITFKELFDKRIKNEEDVKKELDLPVLGTIQKF